MALKGSSFYVFLPSNTDVEGNKTNTFRVRLPRKLEFGSEWMVGLAVLVYPHSWPSLGTSAPQFLRIRWLSGQELKIEIPAGSFKIPAQLLKTLNLLLSTSGRPDLVKRLEHYQSIIDRLDVEAKQKVEREILGLTHRSTIAAADDAEKPPPLPPPELSEKMRRDMYDKFFEKLFTKAFSDVGEETEFIKSMLHSNVNVADKTFSTWINVYKQAQNCCKFIYSEDMQHFSLSLNTDFVESLELSTQLAYIMGFDRQRVVGPLEVAKFIPDMTGGVSSFNVYAPGLIEPVMVGDVTAPLLRMVNIHGRGLNEEVVEENYFAIQYHKLLVKEVSEICIEIRTASGTLMPFQYGTCTLTLHFKKSPYF